MTFSMPSSCAYAGGFRLTMASVSRISLLRSFLESCSAPSPNTTPVSIGQKLARLILHPFVSSTGNNVQPSFWCSCPCGSFFAGVRLSSVYFKQRTVTYLLAVGVERQIVGTGFLPIFVALYWDLT